MLLPAFILFPASNFSCYALLLAYVYRGLGMDLWGILHPRSPTERREY